MSIFNFPTSGGAIGDTQTADGVTYELASLSPRLWKRQILATEINNITNNYDDSITVNAPTFVPDDGGSAQTDNIDQNPTTGVLTITGTNDETLVASLFTDLKARSAVSGSTINLAAGLAANNSPVITQELVDAAVGTGDFVIVDNVLQVNNGITSPGFISFVRINGFLGARQSTSNDTRDVFIVSYRGATHTVYFFKADSTWRSSDSTTDSTNVLTPLIGG